MTIEMTAEGVANEGGRRETLLVAIGSLLCLAGWGIYYVMPGFLADMAQALRLSAVEIGTVSSFESFAIAGSATVTGFALRYVGWRPLALAGLACVVGDGLTFAVRDFHALLAVRLATGFLGEGPLYAASYAVLGMASKVERGFGVAVTTLAVVGAGTLAAEPALVASLGQAASFLPFAAMAALVVPAVLLLPAQASVHPSADVAVRRFPLRTPLLFLIGIAVWYGAPGLFWTFAGTGALASEVSAGAVANALSFATIAGLAGSLLPVLIGDRAGRLLPIALGSLSVMAAMILYRHVADGVTLAVALTLFQIGWNLCCVYQLAMLASADANARLIMFGAPAQLVGLAIGPAIGGLAIGRYGYAAAGPIVIGFALIGFLLFGLGTTSSGEHDHDSISA